MRDGWAVALAVCTAAGALAARPLPLVPAAALVIVALVLRQPALLCVGAALLASTMGSRAWTGLDHHPPPGRLDAVVTLVSDPKPFDASIRVDVRHHGKRLEAWARADAAAALRPRAAGERVRLIGRLTAVPAEARTRVAPRHIAARLSVTAVGGHEPATGWAGIANGLRRTLARGAAPLPPDERALFLGLVIGDDRDQSPATADDFRAAGLSHLLAVSGQNVAFVLAAAWPLLRLLRLRGRFAAALAVLALFGVITRWEPSVLRAVAMACVALFATTIGRPATTLRHLALAVTVLLLIDPLLVRSVGFQLSVAACVGIALLTPVLSRRLPLPVAVTLAAQVGVAPVLAPVFGGVPLAAVPANLLAVAAAGPVMTWGTTAGLLAGVLPPAVAAAIHAPTGILLRWIGAVATWAAGLPLSSLSLVGVAVVVALVALASRARILAFAGITVVAFLPVWAGQRPLDGVAVGGGPHLWRDGAATVLVADGTARAGDVVAGLRAAGVRRLDAVVLERGSAPARALDPVLARYPPRVVLSVPGTVARIGTLTVTVGERGRATVS